MDYNTLLDLGFKHTVAKTIFFLNGKDYVTSRDIETGMHLRQPEVSLAIKELRDRGWISEHIINNYKRGRPLLYVKLSKKPMKRDILNELSDKISRLQVLKEEVEKW